MASQDEVVNILPDIPATLSMVIGDIVVRLGELERTILSAIARVREVNQGTDENKTMIELVGQLKEDRKMLGQLLDLAKKEFKPHKFDWFVFDVLERLNRQRQEVIHDALVEGSAGVLRWQASSVTRQHRPLDYAKLQLFRECLVRNIRQINDGSLRYKQQESSKGRRKQT